jgi:hypothetical protein
MADNDAMTWLRLRERRYSLRTTAALLDSSSARRNTLSAALQQFEEQMDAAKVVTPATRPLNLYYALAQAGMATAAVHVPDRWSFSSHGLKPADLQPNLPDISVQPEGDGGFQRVATATGSPQIAGQVSVGSLWASLPELNEITPFPNGRWRQALPVLANTSSGVSTTQYTNTDFVHTTVKHPSSALRASLFIPHALPEPPERRAWLADLLGDYPGIGTWSIAGNEHDSFEAIGDHRCEVILSWPNHQAGQLLEDENFQRAFDQIIPRYRYRTDRYARPSIEGDGKLPPSPLMTWWLLLYTFSMLARYQPVKWVGLLDLDRSAYAAHLQFALDEALTAIPRLVLEGLDGRPTLLPKLFAF